MPGGWVNRRADKPNSLNRKRRKPEPAATPAPIGATVGSVGGVGQMTSVNGSISGKLPATENSDALAQNRPFDRLASQTNSGQLFLAASQNFVQAGVYSLQNLFKNNSVSAQATPVLQSFQVQQNGDAISVVDRDGSVYHGSLQLANATAGNEPAPDRIGCRPGRAAAKSDESRSIGREPAAGRAKLFLPRGGNEPDFEAKRRVHRKFAGEQRRAADRPDQQFLRRSWWRRRWAGKPTPAGCCESVAAIIAIELADCRNRGDCQHQPDRNQRRAGHAMNVQQQ